MESSYQRGYDLAVSVTSQKYEKALDRAKGEADEKERRLKEESAEARAKLERDNSALTKRVSDLSDSLRKRPTREDSGGR